MKLIDCTISAFGALKDRHIEFNEDITCILEENGFGKTTLAAFIRAMFFSMPTARKTESADKSLRAKYYPWDGGNFGGRLTFEVNGKQYRIIRSFDRYSITADRFELIDAKTGLPSGDFDENIGQQLFGVDENGFSRTTFSDGTVNLSGLPVSIRNKISSTVETADDMDDFEKAKSQLSGAIKAIEGKNGVLDSAERKIYDAKNELKQCELEMEEHKRLSKDILALEERRKELEGKKQQLNELLSKAQGAEAAELKRRNYSRLLEEIEQIKNEIAKIEEKYGGTCPQKETISELEKLSSEYRELSIYHSVEEKKGEGFKELEALFKDDIPSDEEMGSINQQVQLIDQKNNAIEQTERQKRELEDQLSSLNILNAEQIPDENELNILRSLSFASALPKATKKGGIVIGTIISAVIIAIGIAVCFVHSTVGIALCAVGAVALIACLFMNFVKKAVASTAAYSPSLEDKRKTEEFLIKFGFSRDADLNLAIDKLKNALSLKEQISVCEQQIQDLKRELAAALAICWEFMDGFEADREIGVREAFEGLRRRRERYLNEVVPSHENKDNIEKKLKTLSENINEKFSRIGIADIAPQNFGAALDVIKSDAANCEQLKTELVKKEAEAKQSYERDDIASLLKPDDLPDTDEIKNSISLIDSQLSQIANDVPPLRHQSERLSESFQRHNELEELIEAQKEILQQNTLRLQNLKLASEYLIKAKDELSEKYSAGINKSFAKYSALFLDAAAKDAQISGELTLSVEREGAGRIPEFFSSGQKSVMDVCLRLSLIDAMFDKEKPFLILDDPFVSLDEKNLKSAIALLKEAALNRQIIYLTCHKSRGI